MVGEGTHVIRRPRLLRDREVPRGDQNPQHTALQLEATHRGDPGGGRIFALLARYRWAILETDCTYGCPIGSLALELHEPEGPMSAGHIVMADPEGNEFCLD